jgi:hypothetical protein
MNFNGICWIIPTFCLSIHQMEYVALQWDSHAVDAFGLCCRNEMCIIEPEILTTVDSMSFFLGYDVVWSVQSQPIFGAKCRLLLQLWGVCQARSQHEAGRIQFLLPFTATRNSETSNDLQTTTWCCIPECKRFRNVIFLMYLVRIAILLQCSILYYSECTCTYVELPWERRADNGQVMSAVWCCTIRTDGVPCHLALTPAEIVFSSRTLIHSVRTFCLVGRTNCVGLVTMKHIRRCRQVRNNKYFVIAEVAHA